MKTNFNARLFSNGSVKLASMLLLGALSIVSCKKNEAPADETMQTTMDTTSMAPAAQKDSAAMPMDTTSMSKDANASGKEAYSDDQVSIQKALRTIKEAKVKDNAASDEIVLGSVDKAKRKCAMVTFKNGASGKICASKEAIDRIKSECGNTHDCDVKDAQ